LHTDCKGSERAPIKIQKKANTTVKIITTKNLVIKAKRSINDRIISHKKYKLLGSDGLLSFKFNSENDLVFSEVIRKKNANNAGSRMLELIYKLELKHDMLKISITTYINGVFVGDEIWSITRY